MCLISEFAEKCEGLAGRLNKALQHSERIKKYSEPCFHLHTPILRTKLIPCSSEVEYFFSHYVPDIRVFFIPKGKSYEILREKIVYLFLTSSKILLSYQNKYSPKTAIKMRKLVSTFNICFSKKELWRVSFRSLNCRITKDNIRGS